MRSKVLWKTGEFACARTYRCRRTQPCTLSLPTRAMTALSRFAPRAWPIHGRPGISRRRSWRLPPMPSYDAVSYDPPAPVAKVTLRHATSGTSVADVFLLLDTGADITLLPRSAVERLGVK